jgi:4-phytase / acid phosphatase
VDPTTIPIPFTANTSNVQTANIINAGGLADTFYAADPFVMEFADGMPLQNVAWGQLLLSQISQQTRLITLDFAIEMTTPYLNQVQSSNAASHILRSMEQAVTGKHVPGAFTAPGTNLLVINSSLLGSPISFTCIGSFLATSRTTPLPEAPWYLNCVR